MLEMDKKTLKKICRDLELYVTPSVNDKLYLHYKGFRCIQNLEEYTELKVIWLEGNGFSRIEGLNQQTQLRTLYLQENLIEKIENLDSQVLLDTLNLSQNHISTIENLSHMTALTNLSLKSNYLSTAADIEHVLKLPSLSVLDIQSNRIHDVAIVDILAQMPNLKVLYLQGNDVVKHIKQYRKTIIFKCRQLKYLDDRPVFEEERRRVNAWGQALQHSGGDYAIAQEAERVEMQKIRQEKKDRDEENFRLFEQMMADGRRERQKNNKNQAAETPENETTSTQPEINVFSGERIVPVEDCEHVQRAREERWARLVSDESGNQREMIAPVSTGGNNLVPPPPPASVQATASDKIEVDARRMQILRECATVGGGSLTSSKDPFVEDNFRVVSPTVAESSATQLDNEAITKRKEHIQQLAKSKVNELKARKAAAAAIDATTEHDNQQLLPPPAPVFRHTEVDELD